MSRQLELCNLSNRDFGELLDKTWERLTHAVKVERSAKKTLIETAEMVELLTASMKRNDLMLAKVIDLKNYTDDPSYKANS